MDDLEAQLKAAAGARYRLIATDGVFSMDGYYAPLDDICRLADEYDALVMVDDSHAVGVAGPTGRGTPEMFGVTDRVDIVTGTLGKALGGASGGYVSGRAEIVELLRQRSRPYLFSNSVAPTVVAASLTVLQRLSASTELRQRLFDNARYFRQQMTDLEFTLAPGEHPIIPVLIGDAVRAGQLAERLLAHGVHATAFSYPVVPHGTARIRTQMSAAHTRADLDQAVAAFVAARAEVDA
jgi:glycine C-acetyltransferase